MVVGDSPCARCSSNAHTRIAPRRTQRTENLDHYSIVKDRRSERSRDLFSTCSGSSTREGCHLACGVLYAAEIVRTRLVELIGIEPTTSGLQNPRSPN